MRRKSQWKVKHFKIYGRNGALTAGVAGEIMSMVCRLKAIGKVTRPYARGNQKSIMKRTWGLYVVGLLPLLLTVIALILL
jgi:hypothetical protein